MVKLSQPDSDNLARVQLDAVHLGNEDGGHSLIQGSSVHVDGGADRQHETGDSFVNTQVLLQTAEGDGQCTSTVQNDRPGVDHRIDTNIQKRHFARCLSRSPGGRPQGSDPGLEDAQEEGEGVFPDNNEVDAGQEDGAVDDESHDHRHHVHSKLPPHNFQVFDGDDLTTDETGDTEGRVPVQG